jgi:predicted outer membrane protein
MNRTIFLVTIALVLMLMLAPMALAQTPTPTPTPTPVAAELASGGNPAMLLPGAALLLGAGMLTYAIVRRRR